MPTVSSKRPFTTHTLLAALASGTMSLALAGMSTGQIYNNQSGRALDANPGVGSGAINGQVGPTPADFRRRNDLITGNTTSFGAFRDEVGYGSAADFRDALGSDDLSRFRFQSVPRTPGSPEFSAFETFSTPGSGSLPSNPYDFEPVVIGGNRLSNLASRTNPGLRSSLGVVGQPNANLRQTIGLVGVDANNLLEIQADPSLGIITQVQPRPGATTAAQFGRDINAALLPETDAPVNPEARVEADPIDGLATTGVDSVPLAERPNGLGAFIGQQLQPGRLQPDGTYAEPNEDQVQRLRDLILEESESEEGEGADTAFDSLLRDITDENREDTDLGEAGDLPVDVPSQEELDAAAEEREATRQRLLEFLQENAPEGVTVTEDNLSEQGALGELIEELDYELPELRTLVGERESRVAELMAQAEQEMGEGQYFTADNTYQRVLALSPDEPLARAGRVHALMGAGMVRSAAVQLRQLFEDHPELIAARYGDVLLPSAERLDRIDDDLNRMIDQPNTGDEAGIMLAYLGYQLRSTPLIRYGLDRAEAKSPRDSLIPLLRRIWLDER